MPDQGGWLFWGILIVAMVVFLFLPQWTAQRRRKKREEELAVGDRVMTIGGLIGELTYLDVEANLAKIRLAQGVEVTILPGAISGKRPEPRSAESESSDDASDASA